MKDKKIIIIVSILAALFIAVAILVTVFLVVPYLHYCDTHTWATVTARGELSSEAGGEFELTQEYLKGDVITVEDITVKITDISHNGVVELEVQNGNLYDSDGNPVKEFTINLDKQAHFTMDNGTINFLVISNRYQ